MSCLHSTDNSFTFYESETDADAESETDNSFTFYESVLPNKQTKCPEKKRSDYEIHKHSRVGIKSDSELSSEHQDCRTESSSSSPARRRKEEDSVMAEEKCAEMVFPPAYSGINEVWKSAYRSSL